MKLANKAAVITGAGSGMGKAIAALFAQEGAKVVAADINEETVNSLVEQIKANGQTAVGVVANVAVETDVQRMIDTAVNEFGSLDILVNNAGIMDHFTPAGDVTDELWERVMGVNLTGPMRSTRKALSIMVPQGKGVIVNIASVGGLFGSRAGAAYTVSKHGLVGLTKNVGFQYAKSGIRCNAIAPGGVNTNVSAGSQPNMLGFQALRDGLGLSRREPADPMEIAKVALFLASDDASFVNGAVVTADGGWTAY